MKRKKLTGFIIKRTNFGESDKIITLFTKEEGKIKAIAKGSRKMKSKYSGHIELLNKVNLVTSKGKTFEVVMEANLEKNYLGLTPNLKSLKSLYFITEIIDKTLPEKHPSPELYNLYENCLEGFKMKGKDELIKLYFISQYLRISGQFPHIKKCVRCDEEPENNYFFSTSACGVLDASCSDSFHDRKAVNKDFLKLWKFISEEPIEKLFKIKIPLELFDEAEGIASEYFQTISELNLKSAKLYEI